MSIRIVGVLAVAGTVACGGSEAAAKGEADGTPKEAAPATLNVGRESMLVVAAEPIASGPALSGALAAEREATVRAQVAGPVVSVSADQGMPVRVGTLLARIDDRTMRDGFLSARGGVATAQSSVNIAQRELERFTKLKDAGAIADRDYETVKWNHDAAQSQLADAQARLTLAEKQLNDAAVRAPFTGIVSVRSVSAGDVVAPGTAMFTVIDPSSMRLEASIPAAQLPMVRIGSPVRFTVNGYPGRTFEGRVSRINPEADAATGQVRVVVSIPNVRGGLVGGLFADGRVQAERHTAPVVPANAVDLRSLRPWVLRLRGGKAERIEVELGVLDEETEKYEVLKGVVAGDTLLAGAALGITPGTVVRVSVPNDAPPAKH